MAAVSSYDEIVTVLCSNQAPEGADFNGNHTEISISTHDVDCWDFDSILSCQIVKVEANRSSESSLGCIEVQWDLEIFIDVIRCIFGSSIDVTSSNFLPLFEAALYFGVDVLLDKCRAWLTKACLSKDTRFPEIMLDDLTRIWHFGVEHAIDFVPELCVNYLARHFEAERLLESYLQMWAVSNNFFQAIPYNLLLDCVKHPCLTVDSERHLSDALLIWLDGNTIQLDCLSKSESDLSRLLEEIRVDILPLWFAAGKRRSLYFSKLADESIDTILRLLENQSTSFINIVGSFDLKHLKIRMSEYSEKVDLSGCPQITSAILLLSVLDSAHITEPTANIIKQLNHERLEKVQVSMNVLPTLSFGAIQEVDISKCCKIQLHTAIECFSKSFPSLRTIKAAYLLNFKTIPFFKLVEKCPLVQEVDLTVDPTPVIPAKTTVVSSSQSRMPPVSNKTYFNGDHSLEMASVYPSRASLLNLRKLILAGRIDLCDSDLEFLSKYCFSLSYINLKGCFKLSSLVVCDTAFGKNSIQALCSSIPQFADASASHHVNRHYDSLAANLETLHMGFCKGVDETSLVELMSQVKLVRSLSLRSTHLVDNALYNFSGSSLEMLDVSSTEISGPALAHIIRGNFGLKSLNARGCKNLFQEGTGVGGVESSFSCQELFSDLGRTCKLEQIALGWGLSCFAVEALKTAFFPLKSITVGLGGSLGEYGLRLISTFCPLLESVYLHFQVLSDPAMMSMLKSLTKLEDLALCYCLGDISMSSFKQPLPNLKRLRLERVTPWLTNNDLVILTQSCPNVTELSLTGCSFLNTDSQLFISRGWPGLMSIHLEDCGDVTTEGISSLFNCVALEDLLLRHNGRGLQRNFIVEAASKMHMLRQLSVDLCDASDGDFDIPDFGCRYFLSNVKIARCKSKRCSRQAVHEETLVLVWNSKNLTRTVLKERL